VIAQLLRLTKALDTIRNKLSVMWCRLDNSVRDNSIAFLSFELMAGRIALASVDFEPMAINKMYV